jgi:uncharacterized protein
MATLNVYSDIDIKLSKQTDGDIKKFTDLDAVKQSLINILTTKKGDRRMYPTFGASIEQYLFEPMDRFTADRIGKTILQEIEKWDNRINIDTVNINANHDAAQYEISIDYSIKGINQPIKENISFVLRAI